MRHQKLIILISFLAVILISCSTLSLTRDERMLRQRFRQDVANFYATAADAYFVMSYEYHNLSQEYKAKGDESQAGIYEKKATLYYNLSKDLERASKVFLSESLRR